MLNPEKKLSPEQFKNEILSIFKELVRSSRPSSDLTNFTDAIWDALKRNFYFTFEEVGLAIVKLISEGHLKASFGYDNAKRHITMMIHNDDK